MRLTIIYHQQRKRDVILTKSLISCPKLVDHYNAVLSLHDKYSLSHIDGKLRAHKDHDHDWVRNIVRNINGRQQLYAEYKAGIATGRVTVMFDVGDEKYKVAWDFGRRRAARDAVGYKNKGDFNFLRTIVNDSFDNVDGGSNYKLLIDTALLEK